ncbi:retinitis pigmentosa 1-like 1 protein [Pimephales promelas]|nr:retinitis pigmentosa 1-like 1 protein [Pimephales promelas]
MQRAAPGSFDADTLFQNEQFPHPPVSSFGSSVKLASPAKRITFYKSGDAQFKGVKMAIHKRSFKCFDALLDDLSQKVPLPFGVRTITTPRGTHSIKHLEQFEDGGCYLCSDRRHVKPINIEAAGKRPAVWHHHSHPHNTRRKPSRPEEPPSGHQQHHRHPKRIVLVKNNDPAIRRSIILSRRTARSLRVFMDEISELMQCHVKKLYTLEGRKIDNIQSLMQCPSVLVCVGREPFRPLLMESSKKLSDEKLPGMRTRSHSSICSEGHESKKNVNFGLETKKSIIHPRSDSKKSYQNGVCMTPGQSGCVSTCPYVKEATMNDDIEKRVLVNKDGSLSVEMKVRFRLFNDETLQWSTEIKKSSKKVNDSGFVKDGDYLQAKAEYSDPDSISASEETDEAFATKVHQKHLEDSLCQNCCNHCQEYDIWKNPMHKDPGACKSPSSSGSTHRVVTKKSSVDSTHTLSRSSGEYTEHVVEKASCFQQTMEEGDTRVEYCAVSHCCNRSEVSSAGVMSKSKRSEVVNDWLRKIPIEGHVYEMDGELTEYMNLAQGDEDTSQTEKSIIKVEEPQEDQAGENYFQQETNDSCGEKAQLETHEMYPDPEALTKQDCLQKHCHSSVQVMKVLLGPKLDRSSSLPEVSLAYGRKLSQSAQGLLDCLANLRLIDSDSKNEKKRKYNEIMMILQSLWLQKPSEDEQKKQEHHFTEDEFNPRSSSGVDVSSGSTGSVKGSMNGIVGKIETTHGTIPPIAEQEASVEIKDEEENSTAPACECLDPPNVLSDPVTPDIAERVQGSPVNTQLDDDKENGILHKEDVESSKKESDQTPQISSGNESNTMKSQENTSSGSPPSVQRAPLLKRVSQDPDPVWVLNLLKKLENQFMLHYADAMAEFKVRWDLDDNEMLDTMISELKVEVHKRIQSSIHRELQKIQSRTGRGPRPPGNALSRESTVQTEQRRKRLRVMRNKSITMSRDEDIYTASGTENSDQRSEDEYCPCDACMKKKMASRAVQQAQALSLAPVMMEFDLRKILQLKKDPVKPFELKLEEQRTTNLTEENNLEVVHEEVEDTNDVETPDGALNAVDGENINNVKYVSSDSEKRETNGEGGEDEEEKEGEHVKEEVVNGDTEGKEEVEFVEEETEKGDTEEDGEEKNCLKGDAANSENSDVGAEVEKEMEMTETGEETESGDNRAETETVEESTEDESAEDGSESNKDNTPETTEGEKSDETPNEESASEKNAEGSQDGTAEEDGTSNTGQDEDQPERKGNVPKVKTEVEVNGDTENEVDKCSSVEEDLKNDDQSDETVAVICESTLAKQVTRTSMESQPGSVENCTNQTAQAKLKDLQSFMESVESQGDNMVVITKQPPFKESNGPGNLKNMCNGLTEWQVSPKISNRANKQKNTKD